jgi:nitrile hydratase
VNDPRHPKEAAPIAARVAALEGALTDANLVPEGYLDETVAPMEDALSPRNGARVVARAWTDPAFRARLLEDGARACAELGYGLPFEESIVILENTVTVHNAIVCTQCSCTAWSLLGLPPDWYKSPEYRARLVREPRALLREMGLDLPESVAVKIWDTSGETRYMVLPLRPAGTEGWSEEQLAAIVTREAMIGVAHVTVG